MSWIIAGIVLAVPTIHLWLHALLPWWRKQPFLYYGFGGILGLGALFLTSKAEEISPAVLNPTGNLELIGNILIVIGAIAVLSSIVTLGPKRFFMWAVFYPDSVEQRRVKGGIIKYIPHPAYFGYLTAAVGNLLSSGQLYLVGILVWVVILTPIVIKFEEEELTTRARS